MTIRVVLDCALERAEVCRRADDDERGCGRDADSNTRDVTSGAMFARGQLARSIKFVVGEAATLP